MIAGTLAVSKEDNRKEQLKLVNEAEQTCQTAQRQLKTCSGQTAAASTLSAADVKSGIKAELQALSANFAGLRKLIENQEVRHQQAACIPCYCMVSMNRNYAVAVTGSPDEFHQVGTCLELATWVFHVTGEP